MVAFRSTTLACLALATQTFAAFDPVVLPNLTYALNALEPYISTEIMTLHYLKHHQAYVTNYNIAEAALATAHSPSEIISYVPALKFNGGGHINHSQFWKILAPPTNGTFTNGTIGVGGKVSTKGPFISAVIRDFGSMDVLKATFNNKTSAIQGSGWGWLGVNTALGTLEVVTTANQDLLESHTPIIGIDIWEHAYYLQYKNLKADYLNAIWNVINFEEAERRFLAVANST